MLGPAEGGGRPGGQGGQGGEGPNLGERPGSSWSKGPEGALRFKNGKRVITLL